MADTLRAIGVGRQATAGVVAGTIHWLNFVTDFEHKPNLKKSTPKFKVNTRWMERKTFSQTREETLTVRGQVDSSDIGWFLCSAYGPPVTDGHTHTFLAGSTQIIPLTGTNSMLLTFTWYEGLTDLAWQMVDAKVNKISFALDATGDLTFEADVVAPKVAVLDTVPAISYTGPGDNTPFQPWQTVITKDTVAACLVQMHWEVTNNFAPFYCTPLIAPATGAEAGLYPSRYTDGEVLGTYSVLYEFTEDAGSSFYDYRHDIDEAWILEAIDPNAGLGWTPTFHAEFPELAGTSGSIDRSKPNVLQNISGSILYGTTLTSGSEIVLTNGVSAYTAD